MLYLCAGILVGFADGTGLPDDPLQLREVVPGRKGLISACSIGAYGLGSLGFKYINLLLLSSNGLETTFQLWGLIAMSMVLVGGMLMKDAQARRPPCSRARAATSPWRRRCASRSTGCWR